MSQAPKKLSVQHLEPFPTRVWTVDLSLLARHFADWVNAIEMLRVATPQAAGRSNRTGWNSDATLFNDLRFAELEAAARSVVDFVFAEMGPPRYKFMLQAWANIHEKHGYNVFHHHAGALLSACFYLQVPEGSGALVLRDPRPGALLSPWQGSQRPNSGSEIFIQPQVGLLVVFPSWLEHGTQPHEGDQPRISIPINAVMVA